MHFKIKTPPAVIEYDKRKIFDFVEQLTVSNVKKWWPTVLFFCETPNCDTKIVLPEYVKK